MVPVAQASAAVVMAVVPATPQSRNAHRGGGGRGAEADGAERSDEAIAHAVTGLVPVEWLHPPVRTHGIGLHVSHCGRAAEGLGVRRVVHGADDVASFHVP